MRCTACLARMGAIGWILLALPARAAVEPFPVKDLRPGMRGIAVTVFEGAEGDTFPIEILGVIERTGPGTHVILVKGLDERMQKIGITAGMSGSPIYIDGRLVGALAFAYTGATEAIGGATPFEEMQASLNGAFLADANARGGAGASLGSLSGTLPFPEFRERWAAGDRSASEAVPRALPPLPDGLQRLALPVALGGAAAADAAGDALWQQLGLAAVPAMSGGSGEGESDERDRILQEPLRAGDAFSIDLVSGDMEVSAIGTVTWTDGERILALGHPFLGMLPIEAPISRARIHTIVPTRQVSFKVGSPIGEIGALIADRESGVAAVLGRTAPRVPLEVHLRSRDHSLAERTFHFTVVRHEILTPAMLALAARSVLSAHAFSLGQATLASRLSIRFDDGRVLERDDLFRTLSPGEAVNEALSPVAYAAGTNLAPFSVQSVSLDLELDPGVRAAEVTHVTVTHENVSPGDTVDVEIRLRQHLGGEETRRVKLRVPAGVLGDRIVVMAGSPLAFFEWDRDRAPEKYIPRDFDQLLQLMEEYPSEENLIVRLFGPSRGAVHQHRELASLPLSKYQVLVEGTSGDRTQPVGGIILDEQRIATGEVILGGAFVSLGVKR